MSAPLVLTCRCGKPYGPDAAPELAHFFSIGSGPRGWSPEEGLCPACWDAMARRWMGARDIVEIGPDGSPMSTAEARRLTSYHIDGAASAYLSSVLSHGGVFNERQS